MLKHRPARWPLGILVALVCSGIVFATPGAAFSLVGVSAVDNVPYIQIQGTGDSYARASTGIGSIVYVGGSFSTVFEPLSATNYTRNDLYAYDETTKLVTSFAPSFDGEVWGLTHSPDGRFLYVAGNFNTVNGVARKGLAQFDLATGALTSFDAHLDGHARTLAYVNGHLIVGGAFTSVNGVRRVALASLDPTTGALQSSYLNASLSGTVSSVAGATAVIHSAVNSAGTQMAVAGNFTSAGSATHWRVILLDLGSTSATVSAWNAPILQQPCDSAEVPNYVTDLSYAANGTWFAMATSGYRNEVNGFPLTQTVCDAVARFSTSAAGNVAPTWVNYTGCDSLYSVLVEPDAVYAGGHARWLDNPDACDQAGTVAVSRPGIGAIDPTTGQALSWNPTRSRGRGADSLEMTGLGLTVLSDCAASGISGDASSDANYLAQTFHPCVGVLATPTTTTETLSVSNAGSGTVRSSSTGISCGSTCSHDFTYGTTVTLTATPATGSGFTGWSGACTGTGTCTVVMNQAESVTAAFALLSETLSVSNAGSGTGTVTSSPTGIACGSACARDFTYGTNVTLTAAPATGSSFTGWSGACTGTGTCTVTMDRAQSATATFEHNPLPACVVPRVMGKKLRAAKRVLRNAHCRTGKISYRYSHRKKGQVMSERPHPRQHLRNGAKVNLLISRGRRR